ncbi:IS1380 family transposase, partial [Nocardioides hungaricus]
MKASHTIRPVFDDPNLVSAAGLVPVLRLAESAGLGDLLEERLSIDSANAAAKTTAIIGGMLAGADCIDDLDLLRHGAMARLFSGVRAPSTLGTFLRTFTHGHVQQLDAVSSRLLAALAQRTPGLLTDTAQTSSEIAFIDIDDTVREVHGYAKQGAAYGYSKVRGLNIQATTISTPLTAPVIARARLRRGNVASATGAGRMLAQSVTTARDAGVRCRIMGRADSAFYGHAFVGTAIRHGIWFSVTARMDPKVKATITSIPEDAWTPIRYPKAIWEEDKTVPGGGYWVSDAEVAEIDFVAFTGRRKADHVPCRLVVRRVRRLQPAAPDGTEQDTLFATYRHHAFITNSTLSTVEADERHRDHAVVEQVIAELKDNALAHLPSGSYAANAAWVAMTVIAFNLARATAVTAGIATARWATVRRKIINTPARLASTA